MKPLIIRVFARFYQPIAHTSSRSIAPLFIQSNVSEMHSNDIVKRKRNNERIKQRSSVVGKDNGLDERMDWLDGWMDGMEWMYKYWYIC